MKLIRKKRRRKEKIIGQALYDCAVSMWIPALLMAAMEITDHILGVVTADTLGAFADAAFALDLQTGVGHVISLLLCMTATVFAAPLLELTGNFSMLKRSLRHDNLVISHYLAKEPEAAKAWADGELQYQLEDEPLTMRVYWVRICSKSLSLPIGAFYLLYRAVSVDCLLTVLLFALAAIRLAVPAAFKNKLAIYDRAEQAYHSGRRSYEQDIIANCLSIRLLGIQKSMLERLRQLFTVYYQQSEAGRIAGKTLADRSEEFAGRVTPLLLAAVGAVMVAVGRITPGGLAAMLLYFAVIQTLMESVGEIVRSWPLMMNAAAVVERFYQEQEKISGVAIGHMENIKGEGIDVICSGREALCQMDFCISAGEKVGVCGENGSGKSTFGKILASLIRQYHGKITVGNMPYREIDLGSWRRLIAYVPQNPWLADMTVRENIMMGNSDIDPERLMRDFGILSIADRPCFPENGLSGGERQKVSLIRGLLQKSELLILDEPTNDLDQESVVVLRNYIRETKQTVILISHDALLLDEMDRCINLCLHCSSQAE